jgi:dipeptidyl aminopeptidase/acylaminoacyl peptidase
VDAVRDGSVTLFSSRREHGRRLLSPDGRAVAYVSDETGRDEVYVRPFGREGAAATVSTDGGTAPRWSPDGREILYRRGDAFLAANVTWAGRTLTVGDSRKLFEARAAPGRTTIQAGTPVSPDGRRSCCLLTARSQRRTSCRLVRRSSRRRCPCAEASPRAHHWNQSGNDRISYRQP